MREWLITFSVLMTLAGLLLIAQLIAQPTVSNSFPDWVERLDFVAADQQKVFNARAVARSNFIEVFENGLLQTQESAPATCLPACADYVSANVSGHTVVTFLQPLPFGTRVSLIYWR